MKEGSIENTDSKGWIRYYRSTWDHWLSKEKREFSRLELWLWLISNANYSDSYIQLAGKPKKVCRGQLFVSYQKIMELTSWSRGKAIRFFDVLKSEQMITLESFENGTTITIVNYDTYQSSGSTNGKPPNTTTSTTDRTTNETTDDTAGSTTDGTHLRNKESIRVKSNKDLFISSLPNTLNTDHYRSLITKWIQYRKQIKKPITQASLDQLIQEYKDKPEQLEKDINFTILKGWQGLYSAPEENARASPPLFQTKHERNMSESKRLYEKYKKEEQQNE